MNAELIGLRELVTQQKTQLSGLDRELIQVAGKRAEFEALKRNVDFARRSADAFATKAVEQRTELGLNQQKLTSLQLVQEALVPANAAFPTTVVKLITGLLFGFMGLAVFAIASLRDLLRQPSTVEFATSDPNLAFRNSAEQLARPRRPLPSPSPSEIALQVKRALTELR